MKCLPSAFLTLGSLLLGVALCGCQTAAPAESASGATSEEAPAAETGTAAVTNAPAAPAPAPPLVSTSTPRSGETNIAPASTSDLLMPGNRIAIIFSGIPSPPEPHNEQIRSDGRIKPPLLNTNILAAGKTIGQLQEELHSLYVPAFFRSLTVTVKNEERYFFVGGDVKNQGQIPYRSEMSLLRAIQAAGDFTDWANRSKVRVTRADGRTIVVNCNKALQDPKLDIPIYPGDTIHVPRRLF